MVKDRFALSLNNVINNCRTGRFDSNIVAGARAREFFNTIDPKGPFARVGETGATTMPISIRNGRRRRLVVSLISPQTTHRGSRPSRGAP